MNPYANNQEAFDKAAHHLLTQMERAANSDHVCYYRTEDQTKACAIGGLIPDNLYDPEIDNNHTDASVGLEDLLANYSQIAGLFIHCDEDFLADLQGLHDAYEPHEWNQRLYDLAQEWDLNDNILNDYPT